MIEFYGGTYDDLGLSIEPPVASYYYFIENGNVYFKQGSKYARSVYTDKKTLLEARRFIRVMFIFND
jgi:hypothetical protein